MICLFLFCCLVLGLYAICRSQSSSSRIIITILFVKRYVKIVGLINYFIVNFIVSAQFAGSFSVVWSLGCVQFAGLKAGLTVVLLSLHM